MTSTHRRRRGARALVATWGAVLTAVLGASALAAPGIAAADTSDDTSATPQGGAVEVSYTETTEIRSGEGWRIDCAGVGALEGIEVACADDGVTLVSAGFDADLGIQTLTVPQVSGATRISPVYRVRLEPPPVPEVAVDRLDLPVVVGEQALVPLSALRIACAVCTADGGATIRVDTPPPGVSAGVSETHLALRGTTAGDAIVPLTLTDDAGQSVSVELTVTFVPAPVPTEAPAIGGLHVVADVETLDLIEQTWGDDVAIVCSTPQSIGLRCTEDGGVERTAAAAGTGDAATVPAQLLFRVVADDGRLSWGSVTDDADADVAELVAPSWESEAPLSLVTVPVDEQQADAAVPLAGLARLLEGIPAS